jgi:hypothetical protein
MGKPKWGAYATAVMPAVAVYPAEETAGLRCDHLSQSHSAVCEWGNLRRIGCQRGLSPQTVANWVKACAEQLPEAPVQHKVKTAEMDELFPFIGEKKTGFTFSFHPIDFVPPPIQPLP